MFWSMVLDAKARNRPKPSIAFTRRNPGVWSFCSSSMNFGIQLGCPVIPISSMARGRIRGSSESKMASSKRARSSAGAAESCRTARSCDVRGHCVSRAGRIFSTFSGESWLAKPMASAASVAGAVCNVSRSRCVASSPKSRTMEVRSSQSSRKPQQ